MGKQDVKDTKPLPKPQPVYEAIVGINYGKTESDPEGVRVEPGELVPAETVKASPWLLDDGWVRPRKEAV